MIAVVLLLAANDPAFPAQRALAGAMLKQVGVGTRRATIFKVEAYVGALYARQEARTDNAILSPDEPKVFDVFLLRSVGKSAIGDAFIKGIRESSPTPLDEQEVARFKVWLADFSRGDRLLIEYVPSRGTTLTATQIPAEFSASVGFGQALFAMWIGSRPVDATMKRELLSQR